MSFSTIWLIRGGGALSGAGGPTKRQDGRSPEARTPGQIVGAVRRLGVRLAVVFVHETARRRVARDVIRVAVLVCIVAAAFLLGRALPGTDAGVLRYTVPPLLGLAIGLFGRWVVRRVDRGLALRQ